MSSNMGKRVTRSSRLSYYRTPVTYESIALIAPTLRYGSVKDTALTTPMVSLLGHLHASASPGRVVDASVFDIVKKRGDLPFMLDVLTVEHRDRFVFYLNAMPTHRSADGGYGAGLAPERGMQRRIVAGSGVVTTDAYLTQVHFTTNMPSRSSAPGYAAPHVLAGSSMPAYLERSIIITGDHGPGTSDTDGFVPDGFTKVPWDSDAWSKPVAVPGFDINDDLNDTVVSGVCSHVNVVGDDKRVVVVSDFRTRNPYV